MRSALEILAALCAGLFAGAALELRLILLGRQP